MFDKKSCIWCLRVGKIFSIFTGKFFSKAMFSKKSISTILPTFWTVSVSFVLEEEK
jgi:hypothetical protein